MISYRLQSGIHHWCRPNAMFVSVLGGGVKRYNLEKYGGPGGLRPEIPGKFYKSAAQGGIRTTLTSPPPSSLVHAPVIHRCLIQSDEIKTFGKCFQKKYVQQHLSRHLYLTYIEH